MFTGLVAGKGTVRVARATARLEVETRGWPPSSLAGDSVAVNGVCLTAVEPDGAAFGPT